MFRCKQEWVGEINNSTSLLASMMNVYPEFDYGMDMLELFHLKKNTLPIYLLVSEQYVRRLFYG